MIARTAIEQRVREWGLTEDVVEKDYVLGWLLWGIGSDGTPDLLGSSKAGPASKSALWKPIVFQRILISPFCLVVQSAPRMSCDLSGINFPDRVPLLKTHASGLYTEGRVCYRGPRNTPSVASVKLDLSASERVVRPPVFGKIVHIFPDELPGPATVRCYSFEEVFAEKIRAMGERSRPRDLYDIINLFRRSDLRNQPQLIREVLVEKCGTKGLSVPTMELIENSSNRAELESEWENMLAHQLPSLPPFSGFWDELGNLFAWLTGAIEEELLETLSPADEPTEAWSPPPIAWVWGQDVPLETVRFAAANQICIELGYQNSLRLIEPYSLRRSSAGYLLLCAVKVVTRESRTYRVDRIQSIKATTQPFTPVFRIEFGGCGQIYAPYLARPLSDNPFPGRSRPSARQRRPGMVYVVKCPYCKREFKERTTNFTSSRINAAIGMPVAFWLFGKNSL